MYRERVEIPLKNLAESTITEIEFKNYNITNSSLTDFQNISLTQDTETGKFFFTFTSPQMGKMDYVNHLTLHGKFENGEKYYAVLTTIPKVRTENLNLTDNPNGFLYECDVTKIDFLYPEVRIAQ